MYPVELLFCCLQPQEWHPFCSNDWPPQAGACGENVCYKEIEDGRRTKRRPTEFTGEGEGETDGFQPFVESDTRADRERSRAVYQRRTALRAKASLAETHRPIREVGGLTAPASVLPLSLASSRYNRRQWGRVL